MRHSEENAEPDPSTLTEKQEAAIVALLTCQTTEEAARSCGVSRATLHRWMQQGDFQDALRGARVKILDTATMQLRQAATDAVDTLKRNLTCGQPGAEIRAAVAILDTAYKGAELEDLAARIETLEQALAEQEEAAAGNGAPRGRWMK